MKILKILMNICCVCVEYIHILLSIYIYILKSEVRGSQAMHMFNFSRYYQIVFQGDWNRFVYAVVYESSGCSVFFPILGILLFIFAIWMEV